MSKTHCIGNKAKARSYQLTLLMNKTHCIGNKAKARSKGRAIIIKLIPEKKSFYE